MPVILFIVFLLLFVRGKSTDPPKVFSSDFSDPESITVDSNAFNNTAPKPVKDTHGNIVISASITKAKAKQISEQLVNEFKEWLTEESDVVKIILDCKSFPP